MTIKTPSIKLLAYSLSPLERARLVIGDERCLKEMGKGLLSPEERQALRDGVRGYGKEQKEEYAYWIYLWANLPFIFADIQACWLRLSVLAGGLKTVHSRLQLHPTLVRIVRLLKSYPVLISENDYRERVEKNKQRLLNEVLSIEGLTREEAFWSLKEQGKINEDCFDSWFYQNSEMTTEEKENWEQEVKIQKEKIDELLRNSVLKIKEGELSRYFESKRGTAEGITVESWHNYKEKKDKDLDSALAGCFTNLEFEDKKTKDEDLQFGIGYTPEKILERSDLEKDFKFHPDFEVETDIELLKAMSPLEIEERKFSREKIVFKEDIREPLLSLIKIIRGKIKELLIFKETISHFEEKLGTNFLSSDQRENLSDYLQSAREIQLQHDEVIKNLLRDYRAGILEQIKAEHCQNEEKKKELLELSEQKKKELVNEFVGDVNDYLIGEAKPAKEDVELFISYLEKEFWNGASSFLRL